MAALQGSFGDLIRRLAADCENVYLVGHSIHGDLKWLEAMNIHLPESFMVCDIARAYRAMSSPSQFVNMTCMEKIMDALNINHSHMHNAGNDAHYNIEVSENLLRRLSEQISPQLQIVKS